MGDEVIFLSCLGNDTQANNAIPTIAVKISINRVFCNVPTDKTIQPEQKIERLIAWLH